MPIGDRSEHILAVVDPDNLDTSCSAGIAKGILCYIKYAQW
jgi:hypothetical protein